MGLMLFPEGGEATSPDVSWSYSGFRMFREWLAEAEGFALAEMSGCGGDRTWGTVSTTLAPLLDHPDDDGSLTPGECAAMLPRLEAIIDQRQRESSDPILHRRIDDTRQLITVMKYCSEKNVQLIFG